MKSSKYSFKTNDITPTNNNIYDSLNGLLESYVSPNRDHVVMVGGYAH